MNTQERIGCLTALVLVTLGGCGPDAEPGTNSQHETVTIARSASQRDALLINTGTIWNLTNNIPVCFETSGFETEKNWIRDAVRFTWEAEAPIEFTGWGMCSSGANGIRVILANNHPHTGGTGTEINGMVAGLTINPNPATFQDAGGKFLWPHCTGTERELCIRSTSIHEFGHALGFEHEQNRDDTPTSCDDALIDAGSWPGGPQGGATPWGPWDLDSVMNYCNPNTDPTRLSPTDVSGLQNIYGSRKAVTVVSNSQGQPALSYKNRHSSWVLPNFDRKLGYSSYAGSWTHRFLSNGFSSWAITGTTTMATSNGSDMDQFARGEDGTLWGASCVGSTCSSATQIDTNQIVGSPVALATSANQIHVFTRQLFNRLAVKTRTAGVWQPTTVISFLGYIGIPSAISWGPGHGAVFARLRTGEMVVSTFNGTSWSVTTSLGPEKSVGNPSAVTWGPGRIDVFVRGTDDRIYSKSWTGSSWTPYWSQLGPNPVLSEPFAISRGSGLYDVFVRGTDFDLYRNSWNGSGWSGYLPVGPGGAFIGTPAARPAGSQIDVFVKGTDKALYQRTFNGSTWSPFYSGVGVQVH